MGLSSRDTASVCRLQSFAARSTSEMLLRYPTEIFPEGRMVILLAGQRRPDSSGRLLQDPRRGMKAGLNRANGRAGLVCVGGNQYPLSCTRDGSSHQQWSVSPISFKALSYAATIGKPYQNSSIPVAGLQSLLHPVVSPRVDLGRGRGDCLCCIVQKADQTHMTQKTQGIHTTRRCFVVSVPFLDNHGPPHHTALA